MNKLTLDSYEIVSLIVENQRFICWSRLHNMPYAKCNVGIVKVDLNAEYAYIVFLKSYETIVCGFVLFDEIWYAFCTGTYSRTTGKQIGRFCKEILPDVCYYWMKDLSTMSAQAVWWSKDKYYDTILRNMDRYMESIDDRKEVRK